MKRIIYSIIICVWILFIRLLTHYEIIIEMFTNYFWSKTYKNVFNNKTLSNRLKDQVIVKFI